MQPTGPQRRTLSYYLRHKDAPPTWGGFARAAAPVFALWAAFWLVVAVWCKAAGLPDLIAWLSAAMFVGAGLREARQHQHVGQAWPLIAAIVDWDKVERLAAETG